jgi:hypothetical protein
MFLTMLQMSCLIAFGKLWERFAPTHIPALAHRRALTDLVFYILLPALVLDVMWSAPINANSFKIAGVAYAVLGVGALITWLLLKMTTLSPAKKGAIMLAATFPNPTYLGIPVLNHVMGDWTTAIALQFDLLACTPFVMIWGMLMANHYGGVNNTVHPIRELSRIPTVWALIIAVALNGMNIPQPTLIHDVLDTLSAAVMPLMLIALGMSLRVDALKLRLLPILLPLCVISLFIAPVVALVVAQALALPAETAQAVTLLAAMPTMILGIVICERYQLDSTLYSAAVFMTTLVSIGSLTLWYGGLT